MIKTFRLSQFWSMSWQSSKLHYFRFFPTVHLIKSPKEKDAYGIQKDTSAYFRLELLYAEYIGQECFTEISYFKE